MVRSLFVIIVMSIVIWVVDIATPYDNTDDKENSVRSGMSLFTDNLTGCQYLSGGLFGGITPRLNADGKQVCQ